MLNMLYFHAEIAVYSHSYFLFNTSWKVHNHSQHKSWYILKHRGLIYASCSSRVTVKSNMYNYVLEKIYYSNTL